jgi:diguanylate cyclase (GGDEF)-like protein
MLRELALIIQGQLREYDFLARYAGDEFVAVVQELVGTQVEELCSRIETAVAKFSLHVRGDKRARVGISIGTATFNMDGETLDQLLVAADQAMYRVKSSHKIDKITATESDPAVPNLDQGNLTSVSVN